MPLGERLPAHLYTQSPCVLLVVVLDDIRSGNNVGAFFRTADAFRLEALHLCGFTAHPPHRDILKTALGATEHVPWQAYPTVRDSVKALRSSGYKIAAVEQAPGSIPLTDWQPQSSERWAMIFGNEVRGISAETCALADVVLEIPQFGAKKSLNVSVCGGIALWYAAQAMGR